MIAEGAGSGAREPLEVVVLVGLQAAGKSTLYARRFAPTHLLVSKDLLRSARRPARRQLELVDAALGSGRSVVVDNTNPTPADRADVARIARRYGARLVAYYFLPDVRGSLARNRLRAGRARVPDVAIFHTRNRLVAPTADEGFDTVYVVRPVEGGGFDVRPA